MVFEQAKRRIKAQLFLPSLTSGTTRAIGHCIPFLVLFGPPGTGKTFLVQAVAGEWQVEFQRQLQQRLQQQQFLSLPSAITFLKISPGCLLSRNDGETESNVTYLFKYAREKAPTLIFIDEIDSMFASDRSIRDTFMTELSGFHEYNKFVLLIGTSSEPMLMDAAIMSRIRTKIFVPLPSSDLRFAFLVEAFRELGWNLSSTNAKYLAERTERFSFRELESLIETARSIHLHSRETIEDMAAIVSKVNLEDFEEALKEVSPVVTAEDVARWEHWAGTYLRASDIRCKSGSAVNRGPVEPPILLNPGDSANDEQVSSNAGDRFTF
jgi:SpoVK/Ycf46/Vps4 family AAA+-type ATPase